MGSYWGYGVGWGWGFGLVWCWVTAGQEWGMILNLFWLDSGLILGTPVALRLRGHAWKQDQRPSEAEATSLRRFRFNFSMGG